ncbi:helix-turn-helix domain-containing protein [Pseudomonas sp. NPDC007930]|uniref:helix-turn-helix domain-containing protein n=1 Tax=Pseudomonas sp. NPDC007930 TaxID=3364417 RepID=UPI0036EDC223
MNTPTDVQIINGPDGMPAFVVIPYAQYVKDHPAEDLIPNEVVGYMVKEGLTPIAAWHKHRGLSQAEVAARMGISQPAYAQQEQAAKPRKVTRLKIANALGVAEPLLNL